MNIRTNLFVVLATVMLSLSSSMAWSQTLRSGIVLQPPRCDPAIAHCIIQHISCDQNGQLSSCIQACEKGRGGAFGRDQMCAERCMRRNCK
jgi:hypothetical protein